MVEDDEYGKMFQDYNNSVIKDALVFSWYIREAKYAIKVHEAKS